MKKILCIIMSALLLFSFTACGSDDSKSKYNIESGEKPENNVWNLDNTIFPLKEKVKFTIITEGYRGTEIADIYNTIDWQQLEEATNVEIEFIDIGNYGDSASREALQLRLMSGEYGDAIWSCYVDTLTTADIDELGASGIAIALDEYLTDDYIMPNFSSTIADSDLIMKNMSSSDGHIYSFMGVSELKANDAGEALMMVNKEWLAKWQAARGIDHSPETLEEFDDMLAYFYENDMNGNGEQDEIPYFITQTMYSGCMSVEHALGMYGIGTKDSALDMDIMINDDGECYFAYTTDEYKAGIKQLAEWYQKGYIYQDVFTANTETVNSVVATAKDTIGVYNACYQLTGDAFVAILPPSIEGYTAKYHMHPAARTVTRQSQAIITDKCENPEILAAFFDLFYNFDNYNTFRYGSSRIGEGKMVQIDENNKYNYNVVEQEITDEELPLNSFLALIEVETLDTFSERVNMDAYYANKLSVYNGCLLYREAGVWNKTENLWPRCSLLEEDAEDYAFMYTDVSAILKEYRAKFVTGAYDVDSQWDEFQSKIEALGIEDMTEIIQRAYDAWNNK